MQPNPRRFERYVAIGDSSTEGLNDPDGNGGFRGWSRRLAARIAGLQGGLLYANLGVSGLTTHQIRKRQLDVAASLEPDLVTMFSGTNDVLRRRFDPAAIARDLETMQGTFTKTGATVLTFTLPDLTPIMPVARWIAPRIEILNDLVRTTTSRTGAILVDFARYPVATDPRLWHEDRIHANAAGHARIADALAHALGLPDADDAWGSDLPGLEPISFGSRCLAELDWTRRYLAPWIGAGIRARLVGKRHVHSRPVLEPVDLPPEP